MKRKITISFVLAAMLILAAVQGGVASSYPMEITDATGFKVILKAEPMRIVSIVPSITEMLYSVGLGPKMVGVTAWCTYPEAAKSVAKVGDVNINIEAVLSKKPDLVVADLSMSGVTIDKLRELGLPVLAISAENMEQMLDALVVLGRAGGRENEALALVANLRSRIIRIKGTLAETKTRPSVFVEIWNEPLMTAGSGTYVNELIELAGGMNIAGKVSGWPVFSHESVIAVDPFIILLTNNNKSEVMARKAWSGLTAVKSGRVVESDPDLLVRCGPRLVDGLEMLAKLLHPELFK